MSPRFAARPFASSLESLSACDLNTVHSIADPHLRYEFSVKGQYCAPQRKQDDDTRDYFEEYCNSVFFPNWPSCKDLAADLIAACDDEMELNIQKYKDALNERQLYDPIEYLAGCAFDAARNAMGAAGPLEDTGAASETLPNLLAVPTYDRPLLGCAGERKQVDVLVSCNMMTNALGCCIGLILCPWTCRKERKPLALSMPQTPAAWLK